jgi:HemK-related putative methylase
MPSGHRRTLARKLLYLRFRLFERNRQNLVTLEWIEGRPFVVLPGVFNPALFWSSGLLVNAILSRSVPAGAEVLDLGTGSGVAAVFAATSGARVTGVDINPAALRCARINAALNELETRIVFVEGDLFDPVPGMRFDLITFNPPYLRGEPRSTLETAFRSNDVIPRFLSQVAWHLKPMGTAIVLLSSDSDYEAYHRAVEENSLTDREILRKNVLGEVLSARLISPVLAAETSQC